MRRDRLRHQSSPSRRSLGRLVHAEQRRLVLPRRSRLGNRCSDPGRQDNDDGERVAECRESEILFFDRLDVETARLHGGDGAIKLRDVAARQRVDPVLVGGKLGGVPASRVDQ